MDAHNPEHTGLKSVRRTTELLEHLRELDGATVTELSNEMGLAKSTTHGYLDTLYDAGYLTKDEGVYHIGTKFLRLGEHSRTRRKEYMMAAEKVEELAEQTDERAQFVVEENGRGVFLYRASGAHAVETGSGTGKRMYLHATSAGKSILAHLPERKTESIIDRWGITAVTDETVTDREELFEELAQIRERGYAFNNQENIDGLHAIGAPLIVDDGRVVGALSISGPTHRMKGDWWREDLPDLLLGTVNELELNIMYD